jgi:hypothetical protein
MNAAARYSSSSSVLTGILQSSKGPATFSLSSSLSLGRSPSIFFLLLIYALLFFLLTRSASFYPSLFFSSISRTEREEKHEEEYGGKVKLIINFPRQINKEKKRRGG